MSTFPAKRPALQLVRPNPAMREFSLHVDSCTVCMKALFRFDGGPVVGYCSSGSRLLDKAQAVARGRALQCAS